MMLLNKLKHFLRNSISKTPQKDKPVYNVQVSIMGSLTSSQVYFPYGFAANIPVGTQGLTLTIMGQEENLVTLPYDIFTQWNGLLPGEVKVGNQIRLAYSWYDNNGNANFVSTNANIIIKAKIDINVDASHDIKLDAKNNFNLTTEDGTVTVTAKSGMTLEVLSGSVAIKGVSDITLTVGGATLVLNAISLVSSVPISAPSIAITGGGDITGMGDIITQAGKSFNNHTHSAGSYNIPSVGSVTGDSGSLV